MCDLQGTKLGEIRKIIDEIADDYMKAIGGGKLASTRVRKKMMSVRDLASEIRKDMLEARKKK
jgi:uncharacterized protein YxjI